MNRYAVSVIGLCGLIMGFMGAEAGCNAPGNVQVDLTLNGAEYVGVGTTNDYTLSFDPSSVDTNGGTFAWTYPGFTVVGSASSGAIKLIAPTAPSTSLTDKKTITCSFSKAGWSSASDCSEDRKVLVSEIVIEDVVRSAGLPFSLPPTKTKNVNVTIKPTGCSVSFDVINGSEDNGTAAVTANATRTTDGPVTITGGAQTKAGKSGMLKIRARINGESCSSSSGFSVCAHPSAIEYNFNSILSPLQLGALLYWGAEYNLGFTSDSGTGADCSETKVKENIVVVVADGFWAGSQQTTATGFYTTTLSQADSHASGGYYSAAGMKNSMLLAGCEGSKIVDQYFRYSCSRCGIIESATSSPKIPASGFRVTYGMSKDAGDKYWIHVSKKGQANNGVSAGSVDDTTVKDVEVKD